MPDHSKDPAQPAENPLDFEPPALTELATSLDGFEILAFLGKGPLGTVYKANQPKLNRTVALKIFPAAVASESAFAKRFQTEAQTMAKMRHDHIMSVHDFGESSDGKWLYIAMEWVEGDTLERALIAQNWDDSRKLAVAAQLCDALNYAHNRGVIHRDLKPGNVMLADEGHIKIADFGMATIVGTESHDNKLTHSTASIGMPDFVAPEQLEPGNPVDHRADIYSVGVILYKMLTGYIPRGTYRPPSQRCPGLDTRLDAVVARAMEPDPANRYQNVSELMNALLDIHANPAAAPVATLKLVTGRVPERASASASATPDSSPVLESQGPSEKKMALAVVAIVGSVVLILAIVCGVLYLNHEKASPQPIIASVPQPEPKPEPEPKSPPASKPATPAPAPKPAPTPAAQTLPTGSSLDLLAFSNPITDKLSGIWVRTSDGLVNRGETGLAKFAFPAAPSGDYRLTASFTRTKGDDAICFHLPLGEKRAISCFFDFGQGDNANYSGLSKVDQKDVFDPGNPTRVFPGKLETGRRYTARIDVRHQPDKRIAIEVLLDGKPCFDYEGPLSGLSVPGSWDQKDKKTDLGLAVSESNYTIHELGVEILGGELALAREAPGTAVTGGSSEARDKAAIPDPVGRPDPLPPTSSDPKKSEPAKPALTTPGTLLAWARSGPEDALDRLGPPPPWLDRVLAIAAPDAPVDGILALLDDGTVQAWYNAAAVKPTEVFANIPPDLKNVVAIGAGSPYALALRADGTVVAWGSKDSPALKVPEDLDGVIAVSAGWGHALALRADGTVVQWGQKGFGLDDQFRKLTLNSIVAIAAAGAHSIVQKQDGSLLAWGRNDFGQAEIPGNLGEVISFKAVAEDSYFLNAEGRLEHRGQSTQIPQTLENIAAFHVTRGFLAARTRDGAWQFYGDAADKARASRMAADASAITRGGNFCFALRGDVTQPQVTQPQVTLVPPPPSAVAATYERFQKRYDTEVLAAHRRNVAELNTKYRAALERSREAATTSGELDQVLALRGDIDALDALEAGSALQSPLPDNAPAAVVALRNTYGGQVASLEAAREKAALPVIAAYDQALGALQEKLTRELKIEDALAVKTARDDLKTHSPFGPETKSPAPSAPAAASPAPIQSESESGTSTTPLFADNLPAGVIRVAPDGVKIDGALGLKAALAAAKPRQTIALARGRYEPVIIETESLTLIGNRSAITDIILVADGITLKGIESDNVSVGGYRGETPVAVSDIRLQDSRLRNVTAFDGSEYEAVNCIGAFQAGYETSAIIDHCTFISRGLDNFAGHRLWSGSRAEINSCVITGSPYLFATAGEGPETCRIKGSLIFAEKDFLALEVPPILPATEYTWKPVDRRLAERELNISLSGCTFEDPQFVDSGNSDFRLRDSSPGWKAERGRDLGANLDADGWPIPFQN